MATIRRRAFQVSRNPNIQKGKVQGEKTDNGNTLGSRITLQLPQHFHDEDSAVYLTGEDFRKIFGETRGCSDKYRGGVPVVKITRTETGQSIHRVFKTCSGIRNLDNYAGLTYESLLNLSVTNEDYREINELEFSVGSRFLYYWNHPHHATKISTRLGIVSVVLGIVGILFSILLSVIC